MKKLLLLTILTALLSAPQPAFCFDDWVEYQAEIGRLHYETEDRLQEMENQMRNQQLEIEYQMHRQQQELEYQQQRMEYYDY